MVCTTPRGKFQVCKIAEVTVSPDRDTLGYSSFGFDCSGACEGLEIEEFLLCSIEAFPCGKCSCLVKAAFEIVVPNQKGLASATLAEVD
jgi:hypothetical protein